MTRMPISAASTGVRTFMTINAWERSHKACDCLLALVAISMGRRHALRSRPSA